MDIEQKIKDLNELIEIRKRQIKCKSCDNETFINFCLQEIERLKKMLDV
jgi:hypothetical protein